MPQSFASSWRDPGAILAQEVSVSEVRGKGVVEGGSFVTCN